MKLATLAYLKRDGHTLMLHKAKGYQTGKWNGLGGKFELGESPEECLKREVLEESGLTVTAALLKGFITFPDFDGEDDWYAFVYLVTEFTGTQAASDEGELRWVPDADVLNLDIWDGDRVFLPWLERPNLFSAKFIYKQGIFKNHTVTFY
ncbi:8-oxo-dGTP diphosphatase [soil metagenome]